MVVKSDVSDTAGANGEIYRCNMRGANDYSPLRRGVGDDCSALRWRPSPSEELEDFGVDLFGAFLVHEVAGAGDDDLFQTALEVLVHA